MATTAMMLLNAAPPQMDTPSCCTPDQGGQVAAPATNFAGLLQAVLSGVNKGLVQLQSNPDSAGPLDALMQKLVDDKGNKNNPDNGTVAILQQMIAQLQTAITQPVISIAPVQPDQMSQSNNTLPVAAALAASMADTVSTGGDRSALPLKIFDSLGTPALPQKISDFSGAPAVNTSFPSTPAMVFNTQSAGGQADPAPLQVAPNAPVTDQRSAEMAQGNAPIYQEAAAFIKEAMPDKMTFTTPGGNQSLRSNRLLNSTQLLNNNQSSNNSQSPVINDTSFADQIGIPRQVIASVQNGTAHSEADPEDSIIQKYAEIGPAGKSASGDAHDNPVLPSVSAPQASYAKEAEPLKETLPVSRLNELSEPIMKTLEAGGKSMTIKLSPPDLGSIQIKLKIENGVLTADFKVDSPVVKDLFTMAMPQIKHSIEESGIRAGNFFVDVRDEGSTDSGRQQDTNQQQQQRQQKEQKSSFFDFFA